ncbi:gamma-tubulin complex component 5 isoform X2 [Venturia canescens]|uniref:gamma-tubulin complex component 5 isoform X2 n=1 Tax=Venturia canescens TaxID=32260 RepID=UPI001C9BBCF9|nr:gamma-tubulin complex component 5 isoform X2 [Venturia canescens]
MATKILGDIHKDLKLLITNITGFEESDEGFRVCERFVLSNIKHHRYLSVNGQETKRNLDDVSKKLSIHGKYKVAEKFNQLVDSFLTSFDFEAHPQYDLQWSLLCLLLNLSNETNKSNLNCLKASKGDPCLNLTLAKEIEVPEEIDWGQYLKEGQTEFFDNYDSSSESEWSDREDEELPEATEEEKVSTDTGSFTSLLPVKKTQSSLDKLSTCIANRVNSRKWLDKNVQNTWWKELPWHCADTDSQFLPAHLCDLWNRSNFSTEFTGTLTEYQASREILWMFHVPSQMVVFQQNPEMNFHVCKNISIPSLTPNAFSSILSQYCDYYRMINEIDQFGKELYQRYDVSSSDKLPPLTYEEYNAAVSEYLVEIRLQLLEIERKIMKQDDCHTFLTLSQDLEKYMKSVKMIYEIHKLVITDWKESPNWKCTTKLLSGLYRQVQNSSSRERTNLCASLYLSSLTVYLNIIATWLSEGRLEDWRSEFFIARTADITYQFGISGPIDTTENYEKGESFAIRELQDDCSVDPVIILLCRKVKHMGRSIDLLVTLDRMADMWKMNAERDSPRISLNDEFLNEITREFSKYNIPDSLDTTDALITPFEAKASIQKIQRIDVDIDDNINQQILKMDNPFLMKAFENYLPTELYPQNDTVDAQDQNEVRTIGWGRNIFQTLETISPTAVLPFRKVFENTLEKVLEQRYNCASKLVKDILVKEYKLEAQLKLMRSVYMMERGHIMTQFYNLMFKEIETSSTWNNAYSLTCILQEVLSQEWPDSSARWSINVEGIRTHQVLQAADRITLNYSIGWPINMILNEDSFSKYNAVFRFQLKLKWALWTLNNLRFWDLEEKDSTAMEDKIQHFYARRLESLRFWLMHAIGSIHAYLAGQVLQSFGIALEKVLAHADSLDTIITAHNEYLEQVHEHCLQTSEFESLMATIHNLLSMCVHVRDRWKRGASLLVAKDLDLMEKSYTKYHSYIALALHNAVQNKDADYCKSEITVTIMNLRDIFQSNVPTFGT